MNPDWTGSADWVEGLAAARREGRAGVLVTVLEVRGSAPREAGAKMFVTATGQHGSIGGGRLEYACLEEARALGGSGASQQREFALGPALGQCCGGAVRVLFEPIAALPCVAIFGAGHVGAALVRLLATLPCVVRWIDDRAGIFPPGLPGQVRPMGGDPLAAIAALPAGAIALVMTHDHELDFALIAALLPRADLRAVGLIGSATKRARFVSRLTRLGVAGIERLVCPIGVPGIAGKLPAEIAIAVAAQILQLQNGEAARQDPAARGKARMRLVRSETTDCPEGACAAGCAAVREAGR